MNKNSLVVVDSFKNAAEVEEFRKQKRFTLLCIDAPLHYAGNGFKAGAVKEIRLPSKTLRNRIRSIGALTNQDYTGSKSQD